jgi:choline dehydrogenase-like flavoprotein
LASVPAWERSIEVKRTAEVVIIGAGITGCSIAYQLA